MRLKTASLSAVQKMELLAESITTSEAAYYIWAIGIATKELRTLRTSFSLRETLILRSVSRLGDSDGTTAIFIYIDVIETQSIQHAHFFLAQAMN